MQASTQSIDRATNPAAEPLIIDNIGNAGALDLAMCFCSYQMAVPVAERAGHLQIAEMVIGHVVVDEGRPAGAYRREGADGSSAKCAIRRVHSAFGFWRVQFQAVDACVLPGRRRRGRFSGSAKKAKTRSGGKGTHWSVMKESGINESRGLRGCSPRRPDASFGLGGTVNG